MLEAFFTNNRRCHIRKLTLETLSLMILTCFILRDRGQSADSSIVMLTGSSGYDIPTQEVFEALPGMVNNTDFVSLCRVGLWFPGTQSPFLSLWPTSWREVKSDYKSLNRGDRCVSEHTWFSPDPFHRLSKFTFSTWMRHRPREEVDKHRKEHVLCQADDHSEYFPRLYKVKKVQFKFSSRCCLNSEPMFIV